MTDKLWKQRERAVAKKLKGKRSHRQGKASPDVTSDFYAVEVKSRRLLPEWIKKALATAKGHASDNQIGIVVLHEKGAHDDLVLLGLNDFADHFGNPNRGGKT